MIYYEGETCLNGIVNALKKPIISFGLGNHLLAGK